jgi:hypothetical protein
VRRFNGRGTDGMVSGPQRKALVVHYVVSKEFVIDVMMTNVTGIEMMMSETLITVPVSPELQKLIVEP